MAALDATNRLRAMGVMLREAVPPSGCSKADILAAVSAADDWIDSNAASFNAALPQPFRGNASAGQKALLIAYLCMRRAGRLPAPED